MVTLSASGTVSLQNVTKSKFVNVRTKRGVNSLRTVFLVYVNRFPEERYEI